jgi:hypothetical protein
MEEAMRAGARFSLIYILLALLAGCATSGAGRSDSKDVTLTLLSSAQTRNRFKITDAPNPFITLPMQITTLPTNFLAVLLWIPGGSTQSVEVQELSLYSAEGDFIEQAKTKKELLDYWAAMSISVDKLDSMNMMIDSNYLPASPLTKRKLNHEYVAVIVTEDKVKPSDRVTATIKVDGELKSFDIDVGAAAPSKRGKSDPKIAPKQKIEPRLPEADKAEPEGTPIK